MGKYLHDEIFQPWGGDFMYMNAFFNFHNLDRVIDYINDKYAGKYYFKYSTPSEYVDAVAKYNISWPAKYDDMFPYSDQAGNWWTGFYTSRANLKSQIRRGSQFTHAANQLFTEAVINQDVSEPSIDQILQTKHSMLDTMGVIQHHDAVTGTSKQAVAEDYSSLLAKSMSTTHDQYQSLISDRLQKSTGHVSSTPWRQCSVNNGTYLNCPVAEAMSPISGSNATTTMYMAVHNPSSIDVAGFSVPVPPMDSFTVQVFESNEFVGQEGVLRC